MSIVSNIGGLPGTVKDKVSRKVAKTEASYPEVVRSAAEWSLLPAAEAELWRGQLLPTTPPAAVVAAWPTLPGHVRAAVRALGRAAGISLDGVADNGG